MIICDLMTQAVQLIVAVPITFTGEAVILEGKGRNVAIWGNSRALP
jgi:hypothetical protein